MIGPRASEIEETEAQIPIARARSTPGKASVTRVSERGSNAAAPRPWTMRAPITTSALGASPPSTAPAPNRTRPQRKILRRP